MRLGPLLAATAVAAALAVPARAAAPAPQYTLTVLDSLGSSNSISRAISEDGKLAGHAFDWQTNGASTFAVNRRPFLFDGTASQLLAVLPGKMENLVAGVNNAGLVVGQAYDTDLVQDFPSTLVTTRVAATFGTSDSRAIGGARSFATAVNDRGVAVGQARFGNENRAAMFVGGNTTDLGTLAGTTTSVARAVNASGVAAGNSGLHAAVFTNGQAIDAGLSAIADYSAAHGINDAGDIAGWMVAAGQSATTAVIVRDGQVTDLGTLGGLEYATAYDINNHGWVVGMAITPDQVWNIPFLRTDGALIDLNTLVTPASKGDWLVSDAYAINDRGQIAGAVYKDGQIVAALLTPVPEPAPAALLAGGLAMLSLMARRRRQAADRAG